MTARAAAAVPAAAMPIERYWPAGAKEPKDGRWWPAGAQKPAMIPPVLFKPAVSTQPTSSTLSPIAVPPVLVKPAFNTKPTSSTLSPIKVPPVLVKPTVNTKPTSSTLSTPSFHEAHRALCQAIISEPTSIHFDTLSLLTKTDKLRLRTVSKLHFTFFELLDFDNEGDADVEISSITEAAVNTERLVMETTDIAKPAADTKLPVTVPASNIPAFNIAASNSKQAMSIFVT